MNNDKKLTVFFEIRTEDERLSDKWSEDCSIELKRELQKGDVIHFFYHTYSELLEEDFKTLYFRIVERIFVCDQDNDVDFGLYRYILAPIRNIQELEFLR